MKTLYDGSTAFFESKIKKLFPAAIVFFLFGLILFSLVVDPQGGDLFVILFITLVFIWFMVDLVISFFCGPRVIVNAKYIKMKGFPEILLEHISNVTIDKRHSLGSRRRQWTLSLKVEEPSLYPLTFWQKAKVQFGMLPFSITIQFLSKQDRLDLERILNSLINQKTSGLG